MKRRRRRVDLADTPPGFTDPGSGGHRQARHICPPRIHRPQGRRVGSGPNDRCTRSTAGHSQLHGSETRHARHRRDAASLPAVRPRDRERRPGSDPRQLANSSWNLPSLTCVRPGQCGRAGHRPDRYPVHDQWHLAAAIVIDSGRPQLSIDVGDAAEDVAGAAGVRSWVDAPGTTGPVQDQRVVVVSSRGPG
jgi:hypothetical protein